jgi:hypothetical protein
MIENVIIALLIVLSLIYVLRKFYRSYKRSISGPPCACGSADGCTSCPEKNRGCNENCPGPSDLKP